MSGQSFELSRAQVYDMERWDKEHLEKFHGGDDPEGTIGGRLTVFFTLTRPEPIPGVECGACRAKGTVDKLDYMYCLQ